MAAIFRESIVDGYAGRVCPVTLFFNDNTIQVTAVKPISAKDLLRLHYVLEEELPRHSENLIPIAAACRYKRSKNYQ